MTTNPVNQGPGDAPASARRSNARTVLVEGLAVTLAGALFALAADRAKTASLRRFLEENRATSPLFDIPRIVRDIEDVLIRKGSELC